MDRPATGPDPEIEALVRENVALSHAVQTGVASQIQTDPHHAGTAPKHLRTGVNLALAQLAGLAELCMDKGLFTFAEYLRACNGALRLEVRRYEKTLSDVLGKPVKIH